LTRAAIRTLTLYAYARLIGRIHGRSSRQPVGAITIAATIAPCIHYRRSSRRQSPVGCSIKQVFVTATIAYSVYTGRLSRRSPRQSPRVYTTTVAATISPCIRPIIRLGLVRVQCLDPCIAAMCLSTNKLNRLQRLCIARSVSVTIGLCIQEL